MRNDLVASLKNIEIKYPGLHFNLKYMDLLERENLWFLDIF